LKEESGFLSMPDMPKNIETVLNPKKTSGSDNGVRTSPETVADIKCDGPPMINSENAMLRERFI
jgi:hypothetical protein